MHNSLFSGKLSLYGSLFVWLIAHYQDYGQKKNKKITCYPMKDFIFNTYCILFFFPKEFVSVPLNK